MDKYFTSVLAVMAHSYELMPANKSLQKSNIYLTSSTPGNLPQLAERIVSMNGLEYISVPSHSFTDESQHMLAAQYNCAVIKHVSAGAYKIMYPNQETFVIEIQLSADKDGTTEAIMQLEKAMEITALKLSGAAAPSENINDYNISLSNGQDGQRTILTRYK